MAGPKAEQWEANLMQMRINTRLTALQSALELMKLQVGQANGPGRDGGMPVTPPANIDHITLLAMAGDIEKYIIDDLADEARQAIDAAKNPGQRILRVT